MVKVLTVISNFSMNTHTASSKKPRKIPKLDKKRSSYIMAVAVAVIVGVIGVSAVLASHAVSAIGSLYLTSSATSYKVGSTVIVSIRENSGTTTVNGVEADFTYPVSELQYVSTDAGSSAFDTTGPANVAGGNIDLARLSTTGVIGDQEVADVTFTVIGSGTANLAFAPSAAVATPQGQSEASSLVGLTLTLGHGNSNGRTSKKH